MTAWQKVRQWAARILIGALALVLLAFAGDWMLWRVHLAHGNGISTVEVSRMVVAPLKGNREEYYFDGTQTLPCSRSLFPQGGNQACWWLERHRVSFDR